MQSGSISTYEQQFLLKQQINQNNINETQSLGEDEEFDNANLNGIGTNGTSNYLLADNQLQHGFETMIGFQLENPFTPIDRDDV